MEIKNSQSIKDELRDLIESKRRQREGILDQLSTLDVRIDKYDELIIKIDKKIPPLLKEINDEIDKVKAAYDERVNKGCKSGFEWVRVENARNNLVQWVVRKADVKNEGYYAVRYQQKPRNRDYGSALIADFTGNVVSGASTIAITDTLAEAGIGTDPYAGGLERDYLKIEAGDEITDALDGPQIYSIGSLPKVIGIGTYDTLSGVTTTLFGSITAGSDLIQNIGIGTFDSAPVGSGIGLTGVIESGTTITEHLFTNATYWAYDGANNSPQLQSNVPTPTFRISKAAVGTASSTSFNVGIKTTVTALTLDETASLDAYRQNFYAIRTAASIDEDFDPQKNPIDPITICEVSSTRAGLGHKVELVNNAQPTGPVKWREVLNEPFPSHGGGAAVYSQGVDTWPCIFDSSGNTIRYLTETSEIGERGFFFLLGLSSPTTTTTPPPGSETGSACDARDDAIDDAEDARDAVIARNKPLIEKYVSQTQALRDLRDEKEGQAWGLLQASAWLKQEVDRLSKHQNSLTAEDFAEFED